MGDREDFGWCFLHTVAYVLADVFARMLWAEMFRGGYTVAGVILSMVRLLSDYVWGDLE